MAESGNKFVIDDDLIKEVWICQSYHYLRRWDVLPFILFYLMLLTMAHHSGNQYQSVCLVAIPLLLLAQILLFFASRWSVLVRFYVGYQRVNNIAAADHVIAFNAKSGGGKIVRLFRRDSSDLRDVAIAGKKFTYSCEFFEFDKVKYEYDGTKKTFVRLGFPTRVDVSRVIEASGHPSQNVVQFCISKWGFNFFDIPIPLFLDLYVVCTDDAYCSVSSSCRSNNSVVAIGTCMCTIFRISSPLSVPMEHGRLLVLLHVHANDVAILRGYAL
jgi:hypothetical protein